MSSFLVAQLCLFLLFIPCYANKRIPRACLDQFNNLPFCNISLTVDERVEDLLQRLTIKEKSLLLTARASPRGNVSKIGLTEYNWGANCVHGVQSTCGTNCATSFPNPVNLGATFDTKIVYKMAQTIGWELRALWLEGARENYLSGPHVGLDCWSPNININRDPRWGRNMETPSEDPLVNSLYGISYTRGLQEGKDPKYLQAVVTLKHWIAYSFEHYDNIDRMQYDAIVSKYDFADTYFPAFRASVIEGKAKGLMCSYNSLNGVPTCANNFLDKTLREDLNYDGYITSDSGAIAAIYEKHHYTKNLCEAGALAIERGTDVNSGKVYEQCLENLVGTGRLNETVVDNAIRRTLKIRFQLGLFDPIDRQPYWHVDPSEVNTFQSRNLSLDATKKSIVLLQNHKNILPLKKGDKIGVIGPHSDAREGMMGNYYGQICHGDYHELSCVSRPIDILKETNGENTTFWARGCGINDSSTEHFQEAISVATMSDAVILFLGIDTSIEREAFDRETIDLPKIQLNLLKKIRAVGKPTVVVLFNGGAIGLEEVVLHTDGLIEAFYPGFFGAQALADIIFGDANPSGKLPVTLYHSNYVNMIDMKSMNMTKFPGRSYRYFKGIPVFPFGWGLSYTNFTLSYTHSSRSDILQLNIGGVNATIGVKVTNEGVRSGEEIVFAHFRPLHVNISGPATLLNQQLFSYERVQVDSGKSARLEVTIQDETFALVDDGGNLCVLPGFYEVIITNGVGARLTLPVHIIGNGRIVRPFPGSISGKHIEAE